MEETDALRARVARNVEPVPQPEDRRQQPAENACRDVPEGHGGEGILIRDEVEDVEHDRGRQEPEWEDDEHRASNGACGGYSVTFSPSDGSPLGLDVVIVARAGIHGRRGPLVLEVPVPPMHEHAV